MKKKNMDGEVLYSEKGVSCENSETEFRCSVYNRYNCKNKRDLLTITSLQ